MASKSDGGDRRHNPEVDAWFVDKSHPLEDALQAVRAIILASDDRVTESIKWRTPTFSFEGNIVSFNPAKKMVSLLFHRGAEIPGSHPRLEGDGKLVRTMRLADVTEVETAHGDIEAVIKAWCDWKQPPE